METIRKWLIFSKISFERNILLKFNGIFVWIMFKKFQRWYFNKYLLSANEKCIFCPQFLVHQYTKISFTPQYFNTNEFHCIKTTRKYSFAVYYCFIRINFPIHAWVFWISYLSCSMVWYALLRVRALVFASERTRFIHCLSFSRRIFLCVFFFFSISHPLH